jgi:inorganic pyrophosphatase
VKVNPLFGQYGQTSAANRCRPHQAVNLPSADAFQLRFAGADAVSAEIAGDAAPIHLLNDPPYKTPGGQYQMAVEIPAGTNEKWQTDPESGQLYLDTVNGEPRIVNYLPYPGNYGIIPQTLLPKEKGGDGDPLDVIILSSALPQGSVHQVRVIGAIHLKDHGELDTKIIALVDGGQFPDVQDIHHMLMNHPNAIDIVRRWFEGYKDSGQFSFDRYADREEAEQMIETAHQCWQEWLEQEVRPVAGT